MLTKNQDYAYYASGLMLSSKAPMKQIDCAVVSTKDYIFLVPVKTVGYFGVLNTIKTHQLFDGVTIYEGIEKLISDSSDVKDLEHKFSELLEHNEMYVFKLSEMSSFKIKGFFGKHTATMRRSMSKYASIMPKGKGESKEFRTFHGQ